ncbi:MAG TPA: amidohydrolase family protein [Devosiaceae bacterium]
MLDMPETRDAVADKIGEPIIDVDVHPGLASADEIRPYMPRRMWELLGELGPGGRGGGEYPKAVPEAHRQDAAPAPGQVAGSDLEFMRRQYLDPLNIRYSLLSPLRYSGQTENNPDLAVAVCQAMNEWQRVRWTSQDQRLKASILVPIEQPEVAAQIIEGWADTPDFAQVLLLTRTADPLGRRRYWPIYEAAERHGFPVAIHVFGSPGHAPTPAGWPSYYLEEMTSHSAACQGMIASFVAEGVFERFPTLKIVSLEGGFAWLPSLEWRMDRAFDRFRSEMRHLKMRPSEYLRRNLFVATQPIEEPERRRHLMEIIEWIGVERIMFSSDYPHWDFDDPARVLPGRIGSEARTKILSGNAMRVYRLGL